MARIAGVKIHKTVSGKTKSVTISMKQWSVYLEDFFDLIEVEQIKKSGEGKIVNDLKGVKKMLEAQHKIKL